MKTTNNETINLKELIQDGRLYHKSMAGLYSGLFNGEILGVRHSLSVDQLQRNCEFHKSMEFLHEQMANDSLYEG